MGNPRRCLRKSPGLILLCSAATLLFGADRLPQAPLAAVSHGAETARAKVNENYGKLPLSFEENLGQADRRVKFLSQGQGYSMFLTPSEVVLSLQTAPSPTTPGKHAAIRMGFWGAQTPAVTGEEPQAARSSYFVGNDPAKWVTGAPNYARVRYRELYPGVDLVFYGRQRQLEYDLVVAPGADPKAIRLQFDGVESMRVDQAGNLLLSTGTGDVEQHRPVIYQERGGAREAVEGRYVIQPHHRVAFEIARYDRSRPLIVDPVLTFATYLGTPGNELFSVSGAAATATYPAAAVDFQGSIYLTGFNGGSTLNFPGNPTSLGGGFHVFVVKMNSTGTALLYSVVLGGGLTDVGGGVAADASGNAYITGFTSSTNFPVTGSAPQATLQGPTNAFVTEINAAGSALVYSTYLGGTGSDYGRAIAVDRYGNAYVTGAASESAGTNFPVTNASSPAPGFLTQVNPAGTAFVYSTFLSAGIGYGIAVDGGGNAYIAGTTGTVSSPSPAQGYVLKVNNGGGAGYGPVLLGTAGQQTVAFGIALDQQNNAYVTGMTNDANFPQITGGAAQTTYGGGITDGFAIKLSAAGSLPPVYGTYIGGLGSNILPERGAGIGVDVDGYAYVSGTTQCINFPAVNSIAGARNGGPAVLMKGTLSGSNSSWTPSTLAGSFDQVTALAYDASGNLYAGASAENATGGGVYKSTDGGTSWAAATTGITSSTIDAVAVDPSNSLTVYAAGSGHLYQTTNGGGNWTQLGQAVGTSAVMAIGATSPSTVYVGSSTGLLYSTNGGSSWNTPTTAPPAPVLSLAADPNNHQTAYAGTSSGVYKTTDGGGAWNAVNTGLPPATAVTSLAMTTTSTLYAATASGLFYSTNGGGNWTQITIGTVVATPLLVAVDAAPNVYVAFEGGGVAVGTNGGASAGDWSALTYAGLTRNQITALAAKPGTSGTAFAGIVSATDAFLTRISPDGSSFSFSTCMGGADNDLGQNIAVTPTGTVYVSGATASTNLPATAGSVQTTLAGGYDDFVARVDNVPFTDVPPTNAFFNFINSMYELGITAGCATNPLQYCPNSTTTRGQMAVFLITAIEGTNNFTYTTTPYFTDVPASNPFFKFIQKLRDLGITSGCSATEFCPNNPITREEMAVFVIKSRYGTINFTYPTTPYFTDVPPSDPFFPFIQKMAQTGITAGCGGGLYCPDQSLTRGQMAVFIITGLLNQLLPVTTPVVTQVTPASGSLGQTLTVTLSGMASHFNFAPGTTQVTVPAGITASNVTVSSPTSLTVQLTISPGAIPSNTVPAGSPYSIVVTTGSEEAMLPNGFIVQP
jgi:photosystem II stability/assembly factor-like uncharacterized protein